MAAKKERKVFMGILLFKADCGHMWVVVDKEALELVLTKHFGSPCQFYFHHLSPFINHPSTDATDSVVKQLT